MRMPNWKWSFTLGATLMACSCSHQSDFITAGNPDGTSQAVLASVNAASRPFVGSVSGETYWQWSDVCLPAQPVRTLTSTAGELPHLGKVTVEMAHCASADGRLALNGQIVFTAANGDQLFAGYNLHLTTPPPPFLEEEGEITFAGGTGRFENAAGVGTMKIRAIPTTLPPTIESRWPIEVFFNGTITY